MRPDERIGATPIAIRFRDAADTICYIPVQMKLYINQTHSRLFYYLAPVGLVSSIVIPVYLGKELTHVLLSNMFLYLVLGLGLYSTYRQSRVPVFEIRENTLLVNDVRSGKKEIPLDSIVGIERRMFFGCRLLTLSGEISIPLGWLNQKDRRTLLSALESRM